MYSRCKIRGSCCCVKGNIEERACQLALYIIENRTTVRAAAQKFGISKSTVHKDLSERLPAFNQPLYLQVKGVLERNGISGAASPPDGNTKEPEPREGRFPPGVRLPEQAAGTRQDAASPPYCFFPPLLI